MQKQGINMGSRHGLGMPRGPGQKKFSTLFSLGAYRGPFMKGPFLALFCTFLWTIVCEYGFDTPQHIFLPI